MRKQRLVSTLTAFTLFTASAVSACDWMGMGPGMMYGGGYGMGPGMMGPGMMGMDRGMMGGWYDDGWDDRYMGRGMMGHGMMGGYGPGAELNLNEQQQKKITQIQDDLRKKHWDLMGKMNQENAKLRDLYYSDQRDPATIGQQQQRIFDLRRQMMESAIEAQNRMEAVLTPEQKEQMRGQYGQGRR